MTSNPSPSFKRLLSQNFLIDQNIVEKVLSTANLTPDDHVLEIGPGKGALTKTIANTASVSIAIELDRTLIADLHYIDVREGDILKFDLNTLLHPPYKVISNLPYHITSKILEKLVLHKPLLTTLTLMVQEEVADKLVSHPKTALNAFLHFHYSIKKAFSVSRNCYYPKPNVNSAVIHLTPNSQPLDPPFYTFLKCAFSHPRKILKNVLKAHYPNIESATLDPKVRVAALTPAALYTLYKELTPH